LSDLAERVGLSLDRLGVADGIAILAVSGGPDSLALLDLVVAVAPARRLALIVAHYDHGIHPVSAEVAGQVTRAAESYRVECVVGRGELGAETSETRAREARLRWLEAIRVERGADFIVTAHQRDDQVETMLMRFLKGSGPAGLVGILGRRGVWVRPLLEFDRAELAAHAAAKGLEAWDDPSNRDPRHLRGWIRATVLPMLEERLPRVRENLLAALDVFVENRAGWEELVEALPALDFRLETEGASVAAPSLAGYSSVVVRGILRAVGQRLGMPLGRRELDRIEGLLGRGQVGRQIDLWGGAVAELDVGRLRLFRASPHPIDFHEALPGPPATFDVGDWRFVVQRELAPDKLPRIAATTWLPAVDSISIRPWHFGDRIRPIRGRGSRLVVRCMQDQGVARHNRPGWPVVIREAEVIWVPGVCRSDALVPEPGTEAVRVDASPR
jgi:tRNA(Ile)-lysidine synthase